MVNGTAGHTAFDKLGYERWLDRLSPWSIIKYRHILTHWDSDKNGPHLSDDIFKWKHIEV